MSFFCGRQKRELRVYPGDGLNASGGKGVPKKGSCWMMIVAAIIIQNSLQKDVRYCPLHSYMQYRYDELIFKDVSNDVHLNYL